MDKSDTMKKIILGEAIILLMVCVHVQGSAYPNDDPSPVGMLQEQTGTVSGKIELRGTPQQMRQERGTRYRNEAMKKEMEDPSPISNDTKNVVIYLEGRSLDALQSPEAAKAKMDQRNTAFSPHVIAVQKGTTVDITNRDKVYHNVFSLSHPKKFNIGRRPTGEAVPVLFDKPGVVQLFCDIHSQMTAFIIVLNNHFFTQPDEHGSFTITGVPPGTYTIKVWHERLSAPEEKINIRSGEATVKNFVLE